ncbi:thiol-disulfide oxidoreductase DCC family protein [Devriesea agamarum]|uniref:thiol-disulfide oxidoreductase DCC family protein n=1 Tax=Devriesea agamarum TaxID=472569 RepID=UPI00071DFF51|nr:DUF393 domain-containing protein [Devriesea agamarum]
MADAIDLVFDGKCGFCTRSVMWVKGLDRHNRVRLHPSQRPGVREEFDLTEEQTRAAAWGFRQGKRYAGAAAINLAVDAALGIRIFSALYRVPGLRQVQNAGYGWVVKNRYRLPGMAPWCNSHPADCGSSRSGNARACASS